MNQYIKPGALIAAAAAALALSGTALATPATAGHCATHPCRDLNGCGGGGGGGVDLSTGGASDSHDPRIEEALVREAKKGDVKKQVELGMRYEQGADVGQSYSEAAIWYARAAAQGSADAQLRLGRLYYTGLGKKQDIGQAVAWFEKAAMQDDVRAANLLASLYANGDKVPKDDAKATHWAERAAALGQAGARQ